MLEVKIEFGTKRLKAIILDLQAQLREEQEKNKQSSWHALIARLEGYNRFVCRTLLFHAGKTLPEAFQHESSSGYAERVAPPGENMWK